MTINAPSFFCLHSKHSFAIAHCGTDHGAVVRDIREREARLREKVTHPWHHDARERAEQHLRDEAAYPADSPWRYNDITARNNE